MCGIVGALDLHGRRLFSAQTLARMAAALEHRGPDGEGYYRAPGVAMGARRLALVDPEHGAQPVRNERGDVIACCNGELFERRALRESLIARGHAVRSRCDTELWPHLWEAHGESMFDHARGQFALCLWDARDRTLVLARDRAGICPLYVAEVDQWLLWASEPKALLASQMLPIAVDPRAIDHLFAFFSAPARRSFFEGITAIAPGESLVVRDGSRVVRRHSELEFAPAGRERRETDPSVLVDELEALLARSVARRVDADAPVAAYLSGGVDSSTVLALATRALGRAPDTFTVGFDKVGSDKTGTDESALAAQTARAMGSKLTVVRMAPRDVADAFEALHLAADAPVIDTSAACLLRLAHRASAHGFKAVLTGEGADEALAGYLWFRVEKSLAALDRWGAGLPSKLARGLVFPLVGGEASAPSGPLAAARTAQCDVYEPFARARADLYSRELRATLAGHDPWSEIDVDPARLRALHPLNRSLYTEYRLMLPGLLLQAKGDRAAMRSGIEARYPFLDEEVVDFCGSIAPEYKLKGLTEKWLLRQVAKRHLPATVAARRKTMFRASLSSVLFGPQRPAWVDQLLSPRSLRETGLFDPVHVERERRWQEKLPLRTPRRIVMDGALTAVVACQLWHHLFISRTLCDAKASEVRAPSAESVARAEQRA